MFIVITLSWNAINLFSGVELSMRSFFVILKLSDKHGLQ